MVVFFFFKQQTAYEMRISDWSSGVCSSDRPALLAAVPRVLDAGAMVLPGFVPGAGPFPRHRGQWIARPVDGIERRTAIALYAALVADTMQSGRESCRERMCREV